MLADKLRGSTSGGAPLFISASINSGGASTITVAAPANIQNGDFLVAIGTTDSLNATFTGVPVGFSVISNTLGPSGIDTTLLVATKIASSESGNYTFTLSSGGSNSAAAILVYRNANRVNTIGTPNYENNVETATALSITPSKGGVLCAAFTQNAENGRITSPAGMTLRASRSASSIVLSVFDLSPQAATATGDKVVRWSDNADAVSILLQITNETDVTPEYVASAATQRTTSGTSLVIDRPAGTIEGDLMLAFMAIPTNSTFSGATDWVEVFDQNIDPGLSFRIAYKVAGASEDASYTFASVGSSTSSGTIVTYRYAAYDTIGTVASGTNPLILPALTATESQSVLLAYGARGAAGTLLGTPAAMTARVTDDDATSPSYIVCSETRPKGLTGTRVMSVGSTSSVAGIMLSIKPTRID